MRPIRSWTQFVLAAALSLGAVVRFAPALLGGFPLNDGGMFVSMIRDLHSSHYLLPAVTSYNLSGIPYVYPPLGFYLVRLLADLTGISDLTLLQVLPPLFSLACLCAFYLLASALMGSRPRAALAVLLYAFTPGAYAWLVMGGGLTRALGYAFFLLSAWSVYQLFRFGGRRWLAASTVFCGLTILSHPEAALHTLAVCALLWLVYGRTLRSTGYAFFVAAGASLLSAPWWGSVLYQHGLTPFLSVFNSGMHGAGAWMGFWQALFPRDSLLPVLSLLFSAGLIWGAWKRKYLLLALVVLPFAVEPRSAPHVVLYPFCMLAAGMLENLLSVSLTDDAGFPQKRSFHTIVVVLGLYLFVESYLFGYRLVKTSLTLEDRGTMQWVAENTPAASRFVLITGGQAPELDAFQEWFPALTDRRSLTTFQGTEWTLGADFLPNLQDLKRLQACPDAGCIEAWSTQNKAQFDYLLIRKKTGSLSLLAAIRRETGYLITLDSEDAVVYKVMP